MKSFPLSLFLASKPLSALAPSSNMAANLLDRELILRTPTENACTAGYPALGIGCMFLRGVSSKKKQTTQARGNRDYRKLFPLTNLN